MSFLVGITGENSLRHDENFSKRSRGTKSERNNEIFLKYFLRLVGSIKI